MKFKGVDLKKGDLVVLDLTTEASGVQCIMGAAIDASNGVLTMLSNGLKGGLGKFCEANIAYIEVKMAAKLAVSQQCKWKKFSPKQLVRVQTVADRIETAQVVAAFKGVVAARLSSGTLVVGEEQFFSEIFSADPQKVVGFIIKDEDGNYLSDRLFWYMHGDPQLAFVHPIGSIEKVRKKIYARSNAQGWRRPSIIIPATWSYEEGVVITGSEEKFPWVE